MGAVPDLLAAPLEPAGKRNHDLAVDRPAEEGRRGLARAADDDVRAREVRELLVREHRDRPLLHDRQLLGRDLRPRLPEHVGVLEADVREQDDVAAEDVRRVEAAAEPGLDDGDVDVTHRELGERRGAERLELRRFLRLGLGRTRATAASKSASSPSTVIRSDQERTCGDGRADGEPLASRSASIVRVAVDLPFVPTTWIAGYASCGSPSAASSVRIRPSPNSCGHGEEATQAQPERASSSRR